MVMVTFRSAPTPERPNFCSLPCSPTGELTCVPFPWHPEAKLRTRVGVADHSDDFDFDFPVHQYEEQKHGADVVTDTDEVPPLKLSPCLHGESKTRHRNQNLTRSHSSSISRNSVGGMDYLHDFDPEFPIPKHKPDHKQHKSNEDDSDLHHTRAAPPLKLPPRLQENSKTKYPKRRLKRSGSSSELLKRSFSCLSFRDEELDSDPFMAALVQVRDEGLCNNRSQSLPSMKTSSQCSSVSGKSDSHRTSTVSVKMKKALLRCDSKGRVVFKTKLRSYTAALKKFLEMWKSRFKVRGQQKGV